MKKIKKITFAEQDKINDYNEEAEDFFEKILDMKYEDCLVTDESSLSDFSSCGLPENMGKEATSLKELYSVWRGWVKEKIKDVYGISVEETNINLITLFEKIRNRKNLPTLH